MSVITHSNMPTDRSSSVASPATRSVTGPVTPGLHSRYPSDGGCRRSPRKEVHMAQRAGELGALVSADWDFPDALASVLVRVGPTPRACSKGGRPVPAGRP